MKNIVEACIKDDRGAQEKLYREFAPKMYAVCKNYAEDRDEAMDFLQEGFITVFKSIKTYRFEGSLEGWIKRIVVFKCIDAYRKKKKYHDVIEDFKVEQVSQTTSTEINYDLKANKVRAIINQLPTKAALVLKLFVLEDYSHKEIADLIGISVGTSKSQLNRAKVLIKQAFAQQANE